MEGLHRSIVASEGSLLSFNMFVAMLLLCSFGLIVSPLIDPSDQIC